MPLFHATVQQPSIDFYDAEILEDLSQDVSPSNVYTKDGIDVGVAIVHSVKGETHIATLYLETFYRSFDTKKVEKQLYGVPYNGTNTSVMQALRVMYVGMSRPRLFLCLAIAKERFDRIDRPELRAIWDVEVIS